MENYFLSTVRTLKRKPMCSDLASMSSQTCTKCAILVTQTEPNNQRLISSLTALGLRGIAAPCSIATVKKISQFAVRSCQEAECWIFLSSHAARYGSEAIDKLECSKTTIAIGPSTRETLLELGWNVDLIPEKDYDSHGIAALDYFTETSGRSVVLFGSSPSNQLLADKLRKQGHYVKKVQTHSITAQSIENAKSMFGCIQHHQIHALTSHSMKNLEHLIFLGQQLNIDWLASKPLVVVNEKMREYALKQGWKADVYQSRDALPNNIIYTITQELEGTARV